MLVDVAFSIFAPTAEWNQVFKEVDYDLEQVTRKEGSPFVSNQIKGVKHRDGVYYTGLNADNWFEESGLHVYTRSSEIYERAMAMWKHRGEQGKEDLSLFDIYAFYKLAMYGDLHHVEYGVCDNADQILSKWRHLEAGNQRHFITLTPVCRKDQPARDGWRWEKWGEYIGQQVSTADYLYDEKDIERVFVFHIFTLKPESGLGNFSPEIISATEKERVQ